MLQFDNVSRASGRPNQRERAVIGDHSQTRQKTATCLRCVLVCQKSSVCPKKCLLLQDCVSFPARGRVVEVVCRGSTTSLKFRLTALRIAIPSSGGRLFQYNSRWELIGVLTQGNDEITCESAWTKLSDLYQTV
eukprot:1239238-Rhodomonas_salina.1